MPRPLTFEAKLVHSESTVQPDGSVVVELELTGLTPTTPPAGMDAIKFASIRVTLPTYTEFPAAQTYKIVIRPE